jgi:hypothetical protein
VQQRAVHGLAPRAAVAQGNAVLFCLQGLREDGDLSRVRFAPGDITQEWRVAHGDLRAASQQDLKQVFQWNADVANPPTLQVIFAGGAGDHGHVEAAEVVRPAHYEAARPHVQAGVPR